MPKYTCERCLKDFKQKSHYERHLARKTPCQNNGDKIKEIVNEVVEEKIIKTLDVTNLIQENSDYIEKNLNTDLLEELKERYIISSNRSQNVYNFIGAYRCVIKKKINLERNFNNYKLFDDINKNNNIKILWGNCLELLKRMPSNSIGHMVTSPPYYNAREYSTWDDLNLYLQDMKMVILECYRVLDNHRVFAFNVSDVVDNDNTHDINVFGKRKIPLPAYFIKLFEECGFTYVDDIIWDKGEVQSSRHKSGNKPYPFFQYPCNCYEHILIFHKHELEKNTKYPCNDCGSLEVKTNSYTCNGLRSWECKNPKCNRSDSNRGKRFSLKTITTQNPFLQDKNIISKDLIAEWRRDIHKLSPVIKINSKKENILGHTAPFPSSIPEMTINYFSYKGDIVLDMFAGSFTTAIVSNKLGRIGLGFELRKDLFRDSIISNIVKNSCNYEELD